MIGRALLNKDGTRINLRNGLTKGGVAVALVDRTRYILQNKSTGPVRYADEAADPGINGDHFTIEPGGFFSFQAEAGMNYYMWATEQGQFDTYPVVVGKVV